MKGFADYLAEFIIETERTKIDKIMHYIAERAQNDLVLTTYSILDAYYQDYMPPERAYYIRTDELKHKKSKKSGKFAKKSKTEQKRANDISLMTAMKALNESGQPAIGVCRPLEGAWGYQGGVLFDPDYFNGAMKHSQRGFDEWEITENFLFGQHGNGAAIHFTEPHADILLRQYIEQYGARFDMHYRDACKKFKK